jgi:nitroimidazol reductase NimA-like FMN-containing flavoprotein (pyridoxamine 5'-phosphate oxidase superfamily)
VRNLDLYGGGELLTEADCWSLLSEADYGRLVVDSDGRPDVFPVNFDVDGATLVVQTNMGHKLLAALRGPVAFEADRVDREDRAAWSVVVHGRAVDASDDEVEMRTPYTGRKEFTLRVIPERISGRRIRLRAVDAPS